MGNLLDKMGDGSGATQAFARYRALSPKGERAEDALVRQLRSAVKAGQRALAQKLVHQYEADFPMVEVQVKWLSFRNSFRISRFRQTLAFPSHSKSYPTQERPRPRRRQRTPGSWRAGVSKTIASLFGAIALLTFAGSARAVGVTVEVSDGAEALLDSRLARRLITLELADVELPSISGSSSPRVETAAKGERRAEVVFVCSVGRRGRVECRIVGSRGIDWRASHTCCGYGRTPSQAGGFGVRRVGETRS